ncbi:c-type cytochrome domain-containing protein [Sphingobium sp. KCTC 72723]|uniref:c-type cytochrome domain-containing protein n=1 Tax=Sphingobium sp. KCTC 72723 TaxID=2733867 RepID=UPI00165DE273|nr:c-type cytochrome domain-containing protein [Sphingobium sp. KCTC 72723]
MKNKRWPNAWQRGWTLACLSMALICGCSDVGKQVADKEAEKPQSVSEGPDFSRDIQPIFDANCVACHQAQGASGNLNLENGSAYAAIVAVKSGESILPYIAPGQPEQSYLIRKVEGTHVQAGGSGERMPLTGALDAESIARLRRWVKAGARPD